MKAVLFLLSLALCSCSTIETEVTRFHKLPPKGEGQSFCFLPLHDQHTLEYEQYADLIAAGLTRYGWQRVSNSAVRNYVVIFVYDATPSREYTGTRTVYGQTGGGTTTHRGSFHGYNGGYGTGDSISGSYSGTSYTSPSYGPVGTATYRYSLCGRLVSLRIASKHGDVFNAELVSVGSNSNLADVVPEMIDAMFTGFPGKSGKALTVTKANR